MTPAQAKEELKVRREKQRLRIAKWRAENPEKARALYRKADAKKREEYRELKRLAGEA